jgi:hypothetical protein
MKFSAPLAPGRVQIDVIDTIKSFDGVAGKPWTVTFTVSD